MQNRELDGYDAKLVVLSELGAKTGPGYAAVIAEIRAREAQAKILLLAAFPRSFETLQEWREKSAATAAAYSGLVDNETVFYDDLGERFYGSDGNYNAKMWRRGVAALFSPGLSSSDNGVGAQVPLFEPWASLGSIASCAETGRYTFAKGIVVASHSRQTQGRSALELRDHEHVGRHGTPSGERGDWGDETTLEHRFSVQRRRDLVIREAFGTESRQPAARVPRRVAPVRPRVTNRRSVAPVE